MSLIPYTLIRSTHRTLSIQIGRDGGVIARAPRLMPRLFVEEFIERKKDWILKHQTKILNSPQDAVHRKEYAPEEIQAMKRQLSAYIIPRVEELWQQQNHLPAYTSIKITKSERRWGSCSAKNGLCFSYRLAEYLSEPYRDIGIEKRREYSNLCTPPIHSRFIDAIIIHELAHLREKNHQKPFWNLVYEMMPEYEGVIARIQNSDICDF